MTKFVIFYGEFDDFCTTLARGESGSRNDKKIIKSVMEIIIYFQKNIHVLMSFLIFFDFFNDFL